MKIHTGVDTRGGERSIPSPEEEASPGMKEKTNLTMLCDFYELTMGNGYFQTGLGERICYFDVFFRSVPDQGGFAIAAGLAQVIEYIQKLRFDEEDIAYLRSKGFAEPFLDYLRQFRFTGDIWAVPEGTPIFPGEPILTVRAPAIQAQFIETFVLLCLNHQSLIATKSNRIVRAAEGRPVAEFGSRRAQGAEGAILGARASYIAGCSATACTMADQHYGSPATGTMAHSWVQMFPDEYTAFKTYCQLYPNNATLLVDTYNVLRSGVPNAIRAFKEVLEPLGVTKCGIRLDSGDLTYLSRKAREMLDEAGLTGCKIVASNALDEYIIRDLIRQGPASIPSGWASGSSPPAPSPSSAACISCPPSRMTRGTSSPRSRSAKTPPRSPPPISRRCTASSPGTPARRRPT